MPPFSSLNADVIPTPRFIETLETHQPKFDPELIKEIWKTIGLQTSDERLFKLGSAMLEIQMLKIIQELRAVAPQQLNQDKKVEPKTTVQFEDLNKAMEEFGVAIRRPPFLEEKSQPGRNQQRMQDPRVGAK